MLERLSGIDFPPCVGRPRSSEGAFLTLRNGGIMFCYTAFSGEYARDFTAADIACMRSEDGGRTWSKPETIFTAFEHHAMNIMSVSLLRLDNGNIGLFYLIRKSWQEMYPAFRQSGDEGATWSEPIRCMPRNGYYVMNNDRAVRLHTGRIILPLAEHKVTLDDEGEPSISPAETCFAYSDDGGKTWNEGETWLNIHETGSAAGLQEPGILEKCDGTLYGWARTDLCLQYEFISNDGGQTWSLPRPSRFTSPLSPLSMKRMTDGRLLALWNPIPEYNTRHSDRRTGGRTPLVAAVSADDGQTWSAEELLEDDPNAGYCYIAIHPMDDSALLAYCSGDADMDGSCLNRLRIRKIAIPRMARLNVEQPNPMGLGFDKEKDE